MLQVLVATHKRIAIACVAALCMVLSSEVQRADAQVYRATPGVRIRAAAAGPNSGVGDIASAVQLTNGTFVIADNINSQLHFDSAGGRLIRSVGQQGTGSSEFRALRWVGECGRDSVYAFDYILNRISVFSADGTLSRTFPTPAAGTALVRCSLDGTMLYVALAGMKGLASHGAFQTTDNKGKYLYRSPDLLLDEGRPLGKSIKIAMAPAGVVYGNGDSAFVRLMSVRGESPRKIPAGVTGRAPTDTNRNVAIEYWAKVVKGTEFEYEQMRQALRKLPKVDALPAVTDVFVDATTNAIWVRTSSLGDRFTVLERHAMDGALQGTATLPPNIEIQQIRGDVVVAMFADAKTGVESLSTYRLSR